MAPWTPPFSRGLISSAPPNTLDPLSKGPRPYLPLHTRAIHTPAPLFYRHSRNANLGELTPTSPRSPRESPQGCPSSREKQVPLFPLSKHREPHPPSHTENSGPRHRRPVARPQRPSAPARPPRALGPAKPVCSPGFAPPALTKSRVGASPWLLRRSGCQDERHQSGQEEETPPHVPVHPLSRPPSPEERSGNCSHWGRGGDPPSSAALQTFPSRAAYREVSRARLKAPEVQAALEVSRSARFRPQSPTPGAAHSRKRGAAWHCGRRGAPRPGAGLTPSCGLCSLLVPLGHAWRRAGRQLPAS